MWHDDTGQGPETGTAHTTVSDRPAVSGGILIVEDELIIAKDRQFQLEDAGLPVEKCIVTAGENVLPTITHLDQPPGLLLVDMKLSRTMTGIAAARQVRERYPDMPILFFSGYSTEFLQIELEDMDNIGIISKTATAHELIFAVKALFSNGRTISAGDGDNGSSWRAGLLTRR